MATATEIPATSEVLLKTDSSKQFLDSLLGQGWETWGQSLGGSQAAELMLQIFGAFNLVALAIISALFLWVMAMAVAGTAHEGSPFGKKFSSLWMPLRFVGAMGALAPIFKGLSLFQVALLACIGWSINLGNYVWELGVDYFVEQGGQITLQAPDQRVSTYSTIANGTLQSLAMQYYMSERRGLGVSPGGNWKYSDNLISRGGEYKFIFNGNMGIITVDCVDEQDDLCRGKTNAINPAISSLSDAASKLADPDVPISEIDPLALYNASSKINDAILNGLKSYSKVGQLKNKLENFQDKSKRFGWFIAGSSYWSISWINQEVREAMYSGISYNPPEHSKSEWLGMTHGLQDAKAIDERVKNYIKSAYSSRRGILDSTNEPTVTDEEGWVSRYIINKIKSVLNNVLAGNILPVAVQKMSSQDPIMAISDIGDYLIGSAWTLLLGLTAANFISMGGAETVINFALFTIVLPLIGYGLMLAYYLPAIPFIRWISALAGWVILIIESLIAAPLWICAHALPEGDGAAGQHGKRGYMLFLGILIRPPLMVAGFFCAVILINVIGRLVGEGFLMFFDGTSQTKIVGITGTIAMIFILGVVVIMLANKFFSLIHYLPEHVTNWIGQQFHSLGEKEDQSSAKGVLQSSTSPVAESGRGVRDAISGRPSFNNTGDAGGANPAPPAGGGNNVSQENFRS